GVGKNSLPLTKTDGVWCKFNPLNRSLAAWTNFAASGLVRQAPNFVASIPNSFAPAVNRVEFVAPLPYRSCQSNRTSCICQNLPCCKAQYAAAVAGAASNSPVSDTGTN